MWLTISPDGTVTQHKSLSDKDIAGFVQSDTVVIEISADIDSYITIRTYDEDATATIVPNAKT